MQRLEHLNIFKQDMLPYSSLTMLIARKILSLKRFFSEFGFLNSRLQSVNLAFPLISDSFAILGSSKCECLSVLNRKDVYNSIKLSDSSKYFCGILPYFFS